MTRRWGARGGAGAARALTVAAEIGGQSVDATLPLRPELALVGLTGERMIVKSGESVVVSLVVRNTGTVAAPAPGAHLDLPEGLTASLLPGEARVRPGTEAAVLRWRIAALAPAALATLRVRVDGVRDEATLPLVIAERLPADMPVSGPVYARVEGDQAVVGTEKTRLVLARNAGGFGLGALQTRSGGKWRTVAWLPRLGLLATERGESVLAADQASAVRDGTGARLLLQGDTTAGGVTWSVRWELSARSGEESIGYSLSAKANGRAAVLALEGPMLYAGEGTPEVREDAIVPGLEWLVRGEESSSALDFRPDHPDRLRYVPHPYKVTVPAVGMRFGDTAVGLLWPPPPQQQTSALAGPASLVFASPNRFEGHRNHLMGLQLPAVGERLPENGRRAGKPLVVVAGQSLSLSADLLVVSGAKDSLVALDRWFARYGVADPLPFPRGDARAEIAFSLRGYFRERALWNPEWRKWYSDLIVGFHPTDAPAKDLLWGADLLQTGPVAAEARALAAEVLGGDERSREERTQHRADPAALQAWARRVRGLTASQAADGSWRFAGDKAGEWPAQGANYRVLGPVGASEVGLSAAHAADVLGYALVSGDPEARAAGVKALAAMRAFRVPRAAQVWEVPVHTPDILASARAVDAFLAGYHLTGDAAYLRDAVYWARTGLPFVYVWNPHDQPAMRGATIPVLGGTSYVLSWLGVAVQWNGLAYARSLLDLAEVDNSFPWERVAENIVRSAMYQQATEGPRLAQWPDALNFIAGRKGPHGSTPPCFQPATILHLTFRLLGQRMDPVTVPVRQGKEQIALRGTATFTDANWTGDKVRFTAACAPLQRGTLEVVGITRPREVRVNGAVLPARAGEWAAGGAAWRWHEGVAGLEVRLPAPGRHVIEVEGVSCAAVAAQPPVLREIEFRFDRDTEGWIAAHDLAPLAAAGGRLESTTTGADPYLVREGLYVQGRPGDVLVIRLSLQGGGAGGSVFWGTLAQPGFAPARELPFTLAPAGSAQEIRVPVGKHAGWAGQIVTSLRVDPGGGAPAVALAIHSIRLEGG